jgi:hypothetical protein
VIQTKHINSLVFKSAQYYLRNERNEGLTLSVDYERNSFHLEGDSEKLDTIFRQEATKLAADLLKRKHGLNFARRARIVEAQA